MASTTTMANSEAVPRVITRLRRWLRVNLFHGKGYGRIRQLAEEEKRELAGIVLVWLIWLRRCERYRRCQERLIRRIANALREGEVKLVQIRAASRKENNGPAFEKERYYRNVLDIVTPIVKTSRLFKGNSDIVPDREKICKCEFGTTRPRRFVIKRWSVPCARVIIGHKVWCFVASRDASSLNKF